MFADNFINTAAERVFKTGSIYVGLSTTTPSSNGSNISEPTSSSYTRQLMSMGNPVDGSISNSAQVEFETGSGAWGTITHYVLYDAVTGGNFIACEKVTSQPSLVEGSSLIFRIGAIKLSIQDISST